MSGTLPGIALAANNDLNGRPLSGAKLEIYQAGGVVVQTPYSDSGLTTTMPWPLVADGYGRIPFFWLPDGIYRVRLEDALGTQVFDYSSIPAVGQSASASSGGDPSIDLTGIATTGDLIWQDVQGQRSGWVRDNGKTIGSASSGATERANIDTEALHAWLWINFSDTVCPVSGGRGASAAADWAANKPIGLPDKRGYVPGGLDDMGNSPAGRYASVPIISGAVTTAGSVIGETLHTTLAAEMPSHTHVATVTQAGSHSHTIPLSSVDGSTTAKGGGGQTATVTSSLTSTDVSVSNANTGGGGAHNNVQRTVLGTFFRKL